SGNPVATNVVHADKRSGYASLGIPEGGKIVLVVGGSRGAKAFNDCLPELAMRAAALEDAHIVFVTGEIYFEDSKRRGGVVPGGPPARLHLVPYLNNMPDVLAASSLVVSRSGASSLAELTALGIPSVLVPSPNVTNNHQEPNARSLADAGAAVMLLEHELTGE